jgi:hypothetical protein
MYIIAIGWLYVTLLMALTEGSIFAGILSFVFYGLLPIALLLWLTGGSARRKLRVNVDDGEMATEQLPPLSDRGDGPPPA